MIDSQEPHGFVINGGGNQSSYRRAAACAMQAKLSNPDVSVAIFVTNIKTFPSKYEECADYLIEFPYGNTAGESVHWNLNDWQLFHATPFEKNIVLRSDVLLLENLQWCWDALRTYSVCFPQQIKTFRAMPYLPDSRKVWFENNLANLNDGMWYFDNSDNSHAYFKMFDVVCHHWREMYKNILKPEHIPTWPQTDLLHSITNSLLDSYTDNLHTNLEVLSYTEMHNFKNELWTDVLNVWYTGQLKIDNFLQSRSFAYINDDFLDEELFNGIRDRYRNSQRKEAA